MMQRLAMLGADQIDHALARSLIHRCAIVGEAIFVPDGMTERNVEPIDRPAIAVDEVGNRLAICQCRCAIGFDHCPVPSCFVANYFAPKTSLDMRSIISIRSRRIAAEFGA